MPIRIDFYDICSNFIRHFLIVATIEKIAPRDDGSIISECSKSTIGGGDFKNS